MKDPKPRPDELLEAEIFGKLQVIIRLVGPLNSIKIE